MKKIFSRSLAAALCAGMALSLAACISTAASSQSAASSEAAGSEASSAASAPVDPDPLAQKAADFNYSAALDENGYFTGVRALDYVTLPADYKALSVSAADVQVTDDELQTNLDYILSQFAETEQDTESTIQNGDSVNIDYVGSVDGIEFTGGNTNGQGTTVTAGSTQYVDDFLTQIIGHTPGETFDVNVTFPDPYENNPDLAGKAAVFHTTINYIQGDKHVPELTDEFVSQTSALADYGTAQGMKDTIRTSMEDNKADNYVLQKVLDECQFSEFPADLVDQLVNVSMAQFESQASAYGLDMETARSMMGYESEDAQREAMTASDQEQLKTVVMLEAIAKAEGLTVDEDALTNYFSTNVGTSDYSAYQTYYGRGYLCQAVLLDSAMDLVTSSAVRA